MNNIKKYGPTVACVLLGLVYFLSGLAGLFGLAKPPPDLPQPMIDFSTALAATGYFFPFLKITETVFGLLLIINRGAALALVVLAPITINIALVHGFLTPGIQNLILPIIMIALQAYAATKYWSTFKQLFTAR